MYSILLDCVLVPLNFGALGVLLRLFMSPEISPDHIETIMVVYNVVCFFGQYISIC